MKTSNIRKQPFDMFPIVVFHINDCLRINAKYCPGAWMPELDFLTLGILARLSEAMYENI